MGQDGALPPTHRKGLNAEISPWFPLQRSLLPLPCSWSPRTQFLARGQGGSPARGSTPMRPAGTRPCLGGKVWSLAWAGAPSWQKVFSPVRRGPSESGPGTSSQETLCSQTQPFGGTAEVIPRRGTVGGLLALSGIFCSHETAQ